jgi:hypothetical protein
MGWRKGRAGMVSLEDIQGLVDQLRLKILASKNASTQVNWQDDWRIIKRAIRGSTGLSSAKDRKRLGNLIFERLDSLSLEGSEPGPISVKGEEDKIRKDPKAGKRQKQSITWFPY